MNKISYKILIVSRPFSKFSNEPQKYLKENGCDLDWWNDQDRPYKENELVNIISKYGGVIVGVDEITKEVIRVGKNLKVIAKNGVGVDNIDLPAASKAGVYVVNAPGTNLVVDGGYSAR